MSDESVVERELAQWIEARLLAMSSALGVPVLTAGRRNGTGELSREDAAVLLARTLVELVLLDDCVHDLPAITAATQVLSAHHGTGLETVFHTLADASRESSQPWVL